MEEKGSDVTLAAYLLNDAWKNLFEAAVPGTPRVGQPTIGSCSPYGAATRAQS